MTNHVITGKQTQAVLIMFWLGSIIVMSINAEAKQDSWISILIAGVMFLPLMALCLRIIHIYPGLNLFEILLKIFGGVFGRIMSLIFIFFAIHLGSMVISLFTQFIRIQNMPETPEFLPLSIFILLAVWSVRNGPENIARLSKFTFFIFVVSVLLTFFVAIKDMNLNNLKPVMESDFKSLLSGGVSYFTLSLSQIILILCFMSSISSKVSLPKIFVKGLVAVIVLLLIVTLRNILVLGVPTALMVYYPSYQAVSIISIGDFFTRIEVLIGIDLLLVGFIKISVLLYCASLGLTKVLNISDQKAMVAPCGLLIVTLSTMLYSNSQAQVVWLKISPIYTLPFVVILPLIMWIGAEIQSKIKGTGNANASAK
jgi:spore germination protein KB